MQFRIRKLDERNELLIGDRSHLYQPGGFEKNFVIERIESISISSKDRREQDVDHILDAGKGGPQPEDCQ